MATVMGVQSVQGRYIPLYNPGTREGTQTSDKVSSSAREIFQAFKNVLSKVWVIAVNVITKSWDSVTFLFFRVLDVIHPSLSPRIERIFLRVTGVCEKFRNKWREASLKEENLDLAKQLQSSASMMADLRRQRNQLEGEKEDLEVNRDFVAMERDRLVDNCNRLQREIVEARTDRAVVEQDLTTVREELSLVHEEKNGIILQRDELQVQVDILFRERNSRKASIRGGFVAIDGIATARAHLSPTDNAMVTLLLSGTANQFSQFNHRG